MALSLLFATIAVILVINDEHFIAALFACAAIYAAVQ